MRDKEKVKRFILKKLFVKGKWGKSHTSFDNLPKSLPSHVRGLAKDAGKELIKEGLLIQKITSYGLEVSLNPKRVQEINDIIRKDIENNPS